MRILLVGLLIAGMAIPCLAGGAYTHKEIRATVPEIVPEYVTLDQVVTAFNRHIARDHKEAAEVRANGFALGFYGNQTTLKAPEILGVNLEVGTSNTLGTQGFAKAWMNLFGLQVGATSFMAEGASSSLGVFVGVEQYLKSNVSVYADIYPVVIADNNSYGLAIFGGRLYF